MPSFYPLSDNVGIMAEKSEKATPKKLRDARKKGQVAKAQDLPSAFTFVISIWAVLAMSGYLYQYLGGFVINAFRAVPGTHLDQTIVGMFHEAISVIFITSMPVMVMVALIGVAINFLTVGPVFSFEVFKFDIKKFDPVQNLKQKFKLKTLVELLKSLLKVGIASYIIYDVMYNSLPVLVKTVSMPMIGALLVFNAFLIEVVVKVGIFFLIIAIADFVYQKHNFASEMKMEKFEVKQEYKNTEGDPQIKSKRRQAAQEIAYQESPTASLKRASAVITNPTHLAIAVAYRRELDIAPYIVAMAKDSLAERMMKKAGEFNIPIVRNISLAHELWDNGDIFEYVPEDTYEAIAEILRWLDSLNTDNAFEYSPNK
jgi:type III secretion protein U